MPLRKHTYHSHLLREIWAGIRQTAHTTHNNAPMQQHVTHTMHTMHTMHTTTIGTEGKVVRDHSENSKNKDQKRNDEPLVF